VCAGQILRNPTEAEDIAQEVFLRLWQTAARYDPERGTPAAWIWRIARNLCIDRTRRHGWRRFLGLETAPDPADEAPDAETTLDARQRLARLSAVMVDLPERQRAAITMRATGGLANTEIAAALGISEGAAEQLLVRARATLRARLGPDFTQGERG